MTILLRILKEDEAAQKCRVSAHIDRVYLSPKKHIINTFLPKKFQSLENSQNIQSPPFMSSVFIIIRDFFGSLTLPKIAFLWFAKKKHRIISFNVFKHL